MSAGCQSSHEKNISGCRGADHRAKHCVQVSETGSGLFKRGTPRSVAPLGMAGSCQTIIPTTAAGFTVCQCQEGSLHLHCDNQPSLRYLGGGTTAAHSLGPQRRTGITLYFPPWLWLFQLMIEIWVHVAIFAVLLEAMAKQGRKICCVSLNIPGAQKLAASDTAAVYKETGEHFHFTPAINLRYLS